MDKTLDALNDIKKHEAKEKRNILIMYIVFFSTFIGTFVPKGFFAVFSVMICVCTLATIYSVRSRSQEDSILENQCTFLIRTFWRANLYLFFSFILAALYILFTVDYTPLKPCMAFIEEHFQSVVTNLNGKVISKIMNSCSETLINTNNKSLIFGSLIAFFTPFTYIIFRFVRGIKYLKKLKIIPAKKL